jgi:hypothetical protein
MQTFKDGVENKYEKNRKTNKHFTKTNRMQI